MSRKEMIKRIREFLSNRKILKLRDKIAKTDIKCGDCRDIIKCIDIEQHVREKHCN